jgi:hypothetical protein
MKLPRIARDLGRVPQAAAAAVVLCVVAFSDAHAELYRWRDPQTGAMNYSSVPPSWYRRGEGGPPVQIIVDGKPVDRPPDAAKAPERPATGSPAAIGPQAPLPASASGAPIAAALIEASGVRELLMDASRNVERAIGTAPAWSRASPQTREVALKAARTSFLPDKLILAMAAVLAAEVDAAQMRAYQDALRLPIAQRMATLERERMRMLSGPDGLAVPGVRQGSPMRAALIEEVERVSNASEFAAMTVAINQAATLGAVPRAMPVDVEFEFERTRIAVARDLRPRILAALLFVYEPASDEELREYLAFHRRPEVARVSPAVARAYARALGAGFNEWFGALARGSEPATAGGQGTSR